ncbi:unnamed protein product [Boreogadus saida]
MGLLQDVAVTAEVDGDDPGLPCSLMCGEMNQISGTRREQQLHSSLSSSSRLGRSSIYTQESKYRKALGCSRALSGGKSGGEEQDALATTAICGGSVGGETESESKTDLRWDVHQTPTARPRSEGERSALPFSSDRGPSALRGHVEP